MKNVHRVATLVLFSASFLGGVKADSNLGSSAPTTAQVLSADDPDGVPYIVSHPPQREPSQEEIDAQKKQADANKDWLLDSYEKQLRTHSSDQSNNLYYEFGSDQKLSQVSGFKQIDTSKEDAAAALRTGTSHSGNNSLTLRTDSAVTANPTGSNPTTSGPTTMTTFKPLITPLGATDAAGLHNFYGQNNPPPAAPAASRKSDPLGSPDLDTPGQVAAEHDPITKASLTFDSMPDDALPEDSHTHSTIAKDELPTSTDAAAVQKKTDAALAVPGMVKATTPKPATVTSLQLNQYDEPPPPKLATPNTGRMGISSPFSILDH